jgi:hypothetical protein
MKYYVYVSESKVEMVYAQIPANLREKIASELKIDLKVISATFKADANESTKFSKLKLVTEYIERHEAVGTVDKPESYFKGVINMRWGPTGPYMNPLVYFGGVTDETILGLGGSMRNVIGAPGPSHVMRAFSDIGSDAASILNVLISELDEVARQKAEQGGLRVVAHATRHMDGPLQKFEFLAKRLQEDHEGGRLRILLGSPFYVALVE